MVRDEMVRQLVMLPPDAEVVVDIGRIEVDIVEIVGMTYPGERSNIALKPEPDDLYDALVAGRRDLDRCRASAGTAVTLDAEDHTTTAAVSAGSGEGEPTR